MLLETIENSDGLLVYSTNILGENNFRLILKKDKASVPRKLFIHEICALINSVSRKNLIAYRLLTNISSLSLQSSNYGCVIYTAEGPEIIYPDPIFAITELEEILNMNYIPELRFRIQQVGLTSESENGDTIFRERFHFDLNADEAQHQNDSVFVQAVLTDEKEREREISVRKKYVIYEESDFNQINIKKEEEEEKTFLSLSGVFTEEAETPESVDKSEIEIFNSENSLKDYINKGIRRKIFLRFRKP